MLFTKKINPEHSLKSYQKCINIVFVLLVECMKSFRVIDVVSDKANIKQRNDSALFVESV